MRIPKRLQENPEKLDQHLTEESWDNFTPDNKEMAPTEKLRSHISAHIGGLPAPASVKNIRRPAWIAAASITLLAGLGSVLLQHKHADTQTPAVVGSHPPAQPARVPGVIRNSSEKVKTFILADGSKVELAPGSSLSFNEPFIGQRRDIYLDGTATFNVKKDNAHPFLVHSKGITTTVLGTVFSVSDKRPLFTSIHLFSGKVVVKKDNDRSFRDIYLSPGQQLIINKETFSVQIKQPAPALTAPPKDTTALSAPLLVMDFDNRPLDDIFTQLQKSYHITIGYDPVTVRNMSFTGKFNKNKESLESFLHTLCDLNELSLKITGDNSFIIQGK